MIIVVAGGKIKMIVCDNGSRGGDRSNGGCSCSGSDAGGNGGCYCRGGFQLLSFVVVVVILVMLLVILGLVLVRKFATTIIVVG